MLTNQIDVLFNHPGDRKQHVVQAGDENSRKLELTLKKWSGKVFETIDTLGCTASMVYAYTDGNGVARATDDINASRQEDGTFLTTIPNSPLAQKGTVLAQLSLRRASESQLLKSALIIFTAMESVEANEEYTDQAVTQLTALLALFDTAMDDVGAAIAAAYSASTNLQILGVYATSGALAAAVPDPSLGDAYGVGAAAPYDVYIYTTSGWVNFGQISCPSIINQCGIRWDKATAQCVRTGDAAAIPTDTTNFRHFGSANANKNNPFDTIYPWSGMRLCNIDIDAYYAMVAAGDFTLEAMMACVVAWEGDPDFSYTHTDGVWRYRPEFWGKRAEDVSYIYLDVTDKPLGGYTHYPATITGRWHAGVYTRTVNGSSVSCLLPKPGMPGKNTTMTNLHTYASNFNATLDNIFSVDADTLLYLVEYANFDAQTKLGNGVTSLYRQSGDLLQNNPSASAVVQVLAAAGSANCIVGAILDIGTSDGGAQVGSYIISAVEVDGGDPTKLNVTLTTDGTTPASITATTSNYWSIHGLMNKADEDIGSDSGYIGTNGKSNVYYRGAVMFGNLWLYVLGAYRQTATGRIWIANDDDEADAVNALNTGIHYDTGIVLPQGAEGAAIGGYVNALGALDRSGLLCIPPFCTAIGGSSANPVGDYCYVPALATGNTILVLGGAAGSGSTAGPFYGYWNHPASYSYWIIAARPRLKTP